MLRARDSAAMRVRAYCAVVMLVAFSACTPSATVKERAAGTTTSTTDAVTTSTTAVVEQAPRVTGNCTGLGAQPKAGAAQLTWIVGKELRAGTDCLLRLTRPASSLEWGAAGDRLLVDGVPVLAEGGPLVVDREAKHWSRPAGRAVLQWDHGDLYKQPLGEPSQTINFLSQTTSAIYHPAGHNIVAAGKQGDTSVLMIATNEAGAPSIIAKSEGDIRSMSWTRDGDLVFVADHGDKVHVHRLNLKTSKLAVVAEAPAQANLTVVPSPWDDSAIAMSDDKCAASVLRGPTRTAIDDPLWHETGASVVGWYPDGTLVVRSCSSPSSVFEFKDAKANLVAHVESPTTPIAIRAVLPAPPPPPPNIASDAPS
jgi:hypothetical protein